ncbi:MAG: Uma2 family endonuclease [Acidobacteriota bacterium]|nr:Uma2 family endonuclease [Acidobacteriota bacterium]
MSQVLAEIPLDLRAQIENIVTEDDEPVDNLFSAKQQTLLKRPLYASWSPPPSEDQPQERRKFLAEVNVGIFFAVHQPPLVPDFFLSLDVAPHRDWYDKAHRTYFVWEFGKVPEVVLEIVSNRKGGELTGKLKDYARIGVNYYVVYDPNNHLSKDTLRVYELGFGKRYLRREGNQLPDLGLTLTHWQGVFEDREGIWLRWCDAEGRLIPTGEERALQAEAEVERLRAELASRARKKPVRKRSK